MENIEYTQHIGVSLCYYIWIEHTTSSSVVRNDDRWVWSKQARARTDSVHRIMTSFLCALHFAGILRRFFRLLFTSAARQCVYSYWTQLFISNIDPTDSITPDHYSHHTFLRAVRLSFAVVCCLGYDMIRQTCNYFHPLITLPQHWGWGE